MYCAYTCTTNTETYNSNIEHQQPVNDKQQ